MNLKKHIYTGLLMFCLLTMGPVSHAAQLSDKSTPNDQVVDIVSEIAKKEVVSNVDWVNCRNAGGSAGSCGIPSNNEGEPAIPTKYQADAAAIQDKYTYKEDPAAVREQGIAAVEREAAQNGGKTHPVDWQNCMSLGGGSRCGTPMTESELQEFEDAENGTSEDVSEAQESEDIGSQGTDAQSEAYQIPDTTGESAGYDGYDAGDDGYVTSADINYGSSSFDPTGYDRVLSANGNRAGSWIEGIKVRASQQASMGSPGCNPCSGPAASAGGGGGLLGGSSLLSGLGIDKALNIAEKLGVNTSGFKEGLAAVDKGISMANNVGSMVSGAPTQLASLGNSLSGKMSGAVPSMGNLNLGSLTNSAASLAKAGSSITNAASSLTSGNFSSVASAKEALARVKDGANKVQGMVAQGKEVVTTAQNAAKTVGSASTLSGKLRGIVTPPPGG